MKTTLKGKSVIITGGANGIGFATAERLAKEGCIVTLWDIDEHGLKKAKNKLSGNNSQIFIYKCDITDHSRVYELADKANVDMGHIDILINNAGYVKQGNLIEQPLNQWEKTIEVNITAVVNTIKAVLPFMYIRNSGHIINISSAAGIIGVGGLSVYSATKWAVWGLTESMRLETLRDGKKGIRWSSIHPSYLTQGMFKGAKLNLLGNFIVPIVKSYDVIAKAIVNDAVIKGKSIVCRPRSLRLSIILRGILPDFLFQKLLVLLGVHKSMDSFTGKE